MKAYILCLIAVLFSIYGFSQTGIGTDTPNSSAELEVNSDTAGVLIPRVTSVEMNAIASPANGLMVYNTNFSCFYYYITGTGWSRANYNYISVVSDSDGDTKITLEEDTEDVIHLFADGDHNATNNGATDEVLEINSGGLNLKYTSDKYLIDGENALYAPSNNVFAGTSAGDAITSGDNNTVVGSNAGSSITTGSSNLLIGASSGQNITTGSGNSFIGAESGKGGTTLTGSNNLAVGANSLPVIEGAANTNTAIGYSAGSSLTTGSNNVLIGESAGSNLTTGSGNIIIGDNALATDPTSANTLNIAGMIGTTDHTDIASNVMFANAYTFPEITGEEGETFVVDINGDLQWGEKNTSGESSITVTGSATNLKPYNKVLSLGQLATSGELYFIPVTAMANGDITKLTTYLANVDALTNGNPYLNLSLGLYYVDGGTLRVAIGTSGDPIKGVRQVVPADAEQTLTIDLFSPDNNKYAVTAGEQYYIAFWGANKDNDVEFIYTSDQDFQSYKLNISSGSRTTYSLQNSYTISSLSPSDKTPWARAH